MAGFLGGKNIYDDDGALKVGLPFRFEDGEFSQSVGTTAGSQQAMYDGNDTTYYQLSIEEGHPSTEYNCVWDFKRKIKFKNIYAYVSTSNRGGGTSTMTLYGSNNGSDWTQIAQATTKSVLEDKRNLLGTNVSYRYIKVAFNGNQGSRQDMIYSIKGIV